MPIDPISDNANYVSIATAIVQGQGVAMNGELSAYFPVGYPGFLAVIFSIFGISLFPAQLANVVLYMGILLCTTALTEKLFQSKLTARVTLLLLAFYPSHIYYSSQLGTETPFLFLVLLWAIIMLDKQDSIKFLILSGIIGGLCCLIRPQALYIPVIIVGTSVILNLSRGMFVQKVKELLILYLVMSITIAPWAIRNYIVFDHFIPFSTISGKNLLIGNNPNATGGYYWSDELTKITDAPDEFTRDEQAKAAALEYIRSEPGRFITMIPIRFAKLYLKDYDSINWYERERGDAITETEVTVFAAAKIIAQSYYVIIMALAGLGTIRLFRRSRKNLRRFPLHPLAMIFYFSSIFLVYYGTARYHFPMMPWIIMFSGYYLTGIIASQSPRDDCQDRQSQIR